MTRHGKQRWTDERERSLIDLLLQIRCGELTDEEASRGLRDIVLALGSATDDKCTKHIEVLGQEAVELLFV